MTSGLELEAFLTELGRRRERVLELAEPTAFNPDDLIEELTELSEQLVVADEELRVQQEELAQTRRALLNASTARDLLLEDSSKARAITDGRGVVTMSTPALQRLIGQPPTRLTPRPIATWFEVPDRRAIRSAIGGIDAVGSRQHVGTLRVRIAGGDPILVTVRVEGIADPSASQVLLRWELTPVEPGSRRLQPVPDPEATTDDAGQVNLAVALAGAVVELETSSTDDELLAHAVAAAVRLIPGAQRAELVLHNADGVQTAASLPPAEESGVQGPGHTERSFALAVRDGRIGSLIVTAAEPDHLDEVGELCAASLAAQTALALGRLSEMRNLRRAIDTRQVIGQAVGILVERHRLAPDAAFARLVRQSQHANIKLRDLAQELVRTGSETGGGFPQISNA